MPDLGFQIESAESVPFAATPIIAFRLRVENSLPGESIHSIALHAQIQIETPKRRYSPDEQERLLDLFGEPGRWGQTLRPMLWTHADLTVPAFSDSVTVDCQVPCSFDFNLAATKYFYGLTDGDIPLIFLFSGNLLLRRRAWRPGSGAHPLEQGSALPASRSCVARNDGELLSKLRVAANPAGCV